MKKTALYFILILTLKAQISLAQLTPKELSVELTATTQVSPPRITLSWPTNSISVSYLISRKSKTATSFGAATATLSGSTTQFIDSSVAVGVHYEYQVTRNSFTIGATGYGYINSGIQIPIVENRGKMILMVDSAFIIPLAAELNRLENDLEGDGWTVIRHNVLRTGSVTHIKALIIADYNLDPINTKAVFLFGHIPVPYSGNVAPDGHSDHVGANPADTYYGDVNGVWTDVSVTSTTLSPIRNQNVPGDGKFDQSQIPSDVELQVGRVDLYDLPLFSASEQQLLKNYLDKNHDYRKKVFTPIYRAVIDDNFGTYSGGLSQTAFRNFSPLVGTYSVTEADYFTSMTAGNSYQWSFACGPGSYTGCTGVGSTTNFAASNLGGVFTMMIGSYFGDWDITNNFLRAALAQGKTLTNIWSGRPIYYFHNMAMGENIGYSNKLCQNQMGTYFTPGYNRWVHASLLGDPSLRNNIVSPVSNVVATKANNNCLITWSASTQTNVLGYNIYMKNDTTKTYSRINASLVAGTTYTDNCLLYPGIYKYMVRAVVLEKTPSGTYYNMSEGIADTALNTNYLIVKITNTNAANSVFTYSFNVTASNATVYSWNFGDSNTSTQQNPVHTYSTSGSYTATVIASNGCHSDTAYINTMIMLGVDQFSKAKKTLLVYPNPSAGKFTITLSEQTNEPFDVLIYNNEGKRIYQETSITNSNEIDLGDCATGLYFLQVRDKDKVNYNKKFFVE